eukprot:TRINITY_DN103164_c0_g1_i1.p1 TRINITY_DN103164_c0_g1~~TRINITY_DN103164_c0_g1_i1.p1  ORF type:complete len:209 (-),score=47.15 TRINITY_DN103164_c0_g1_i1:12-638(-)
MQKPQRLPELLPAALELAQRKLYDRIVAGAKDASGKPVKTRVNEVTGGLLGPFNAFLRSPELGGDIAQLADRLRFGGLEASQRLLELCILCTVRRCGAQYVVWSHRKLAKAAGVPPEVIELLCQGDYKKEELARHLDREEVAALDLCEELLHPSMEVRQETYTTVLETLGERRTFEVAVTVGFYLLLSSVIKTFDVQPPPGEVRSAKL